MKDICTITDLTLKTLIFIMSLMVLKAESVADIFYRRKLTEVLVLRIVLKQEPCDRVFTLCLQATNVISCHGNKRATV